MASRDDEIDRTRRRGNSRDELAAQRAMVAGMRRGLRIGGGHGVKKQTLTPGKLAASGGRKQSGRVGRHEGRATRSFHMSTKTIQVGGNPGRYLTYICREGEFKQRDDLLYISGNPEVLKQHIEEIERTALKRKGPTAEQVARKIVHELPYDCTPEQSRKIADREVEHWKQKGFEAVAAVHGADVDHDQPHIHILVAGRRTTVGPDGSITVLREGRDVPMPYTRSKRDYRVFLCDEINRIADPAVRFWPKKDAEMDEPGIVGRAPRSRVPEWKWHREGYKEIDPAKAARLAKKREKIQAEQAAKAPEREAKKAKAAEKRGKTIRPFMPPTEAQKKKIAVGAMKAGIKLPKDWRTALDGGDLLGAIKAAERGDRDRCYTLVAEAQKRAELLAPVLAPLLAAGPVREESLTDRLKTSASNIRFEPKIRAAARREIEIAVDGAIEAEKWAFHADEAVRAVQDRYEWQIAVGDALAASEHAEEAQAFTRAVDDVNVAMSDGAAWDRAADDAGRVLADRLAWQAGIDGAMAAGRQWQLSARLAQAAEAAGANMATRQAWTDGLEQLDGLDSTTIPALTASLNQAQQRKSTNVARRNHRADRSSQSEDRSEAINSAASGDDYGNLEKYSEAGTVGRPESGASSSGSDDRIFDSDQPRPGTTGDNDHANTRASADQSAGLRLGGRRVNLVLRKSPRNIHRVSLDDKCVAILMPQQGQHYIVPLDGNVQNAGPLKLLDGAPIDASKDINSEIAARFEEFYIANPKLKPPQQPAEALAPKVAPVPAPPAPAQEATMAKPAPKPRPPTENELRNADIEKIITDEPNIRQAWSDIDLRLAQDIDQMKHGDLADALINGSQNRYDLAQSAGYLSNENLARINARDKERYEIDPPKNPSREVIEKQEQERQTAADRIRAAFAKLASVPAAKDAFEAGKRLMEALKEMMEVNKPQAKQNTDKRHPDQKHPDEITPEDFKQLVREERERQMKDPAVYFHRDRAEVVVARRLAEKRRALEERNSGWQQQPPIIIVVQQQHGEDLDRLIGRLSDPSKLHALTAHLKTIGEEVRYPASRPIDLVPPASMTKMAQSIEQLITAELAKHRPSQAASTPSPSASSVSKAQQPTSAGIYWPREDFENAAQRREDIMRRLKDASPRELEELRVASKTLAAEKKKLSADVSAQCYANGVKQVEVVMVDRGLLSVDDTAAGRLRAAQERHRQQAACRRGGGRVD